MYYFYSLSETHYIIIKERICLVGWFSLTDPFKQLMH